MNNFSPTHRFIFSTLLLGVIAVGTAYMFSGVASLLVGGTLSLLLWIFRPLLMPPGYGATRVRLLSLMGVFALATSYGFWSQLIDAAALAISQNQSVLEAVPWLSGLKLGSAPSIGVLAFVTISVWGVNRYMVDSSIAGGHPVPLADEFPEETFQQKLESFCSALRQHLITTDREANWSPEYYADLEAEVEVVSAAGISAKKKIADLQHAIRSDRKTKAFLILGDPGGGKSVSLRKLARDMLDEVGTTGRVPIYINLREWLPPEGQEKIQWTEDRKPTIQELENFVVENVKSRGDVFTEEFVDQYFRTLWRHGRLFFVFDSFDEIPELLDVNEESWLINALSDVLSRFISSQRGSRGVLASRMFRRPTQVFLAQKILEIRPMAESRIIQALHRFPTFTTELQTQLFRDRSDLIPLARNPFLMALLGEWVKANHALPDNQASLYENYLSGRLKLCATKLRKGNLQISDVLEGAEQIAWFVFKSPAYGLEAPVHVIAEELGLKNAATIIEVLSFGRIARVTSNELKSFAFVHRRFLEYFVTKRLLNSPQDVPIDHIPTDSRGRDALVLYAQLCDVDSASSLAAHCWREISEHFGQADTHLRAIHSLRFLIDAFRSRRTAIAPFEEALVLFTQQHAEQDDDIIRAKLCLEGTGLLSETESLPILTAALIGRNSWLQETAFRACRHLPSSNPRLEKALSDYVITLPSRQFWAVKRDLVFSLSLSESMKGVLKSATMRYRNMVSAVVAIPIAISLQPKLALGVVGVVVEMCLLPIALVGLHEILLKFKAESTVANGLHKKILKANDWLSDTEGLTRLTRQLFGFAMLIVGVLALIVLVFSPDAKDMGQRPFWGLFNSYPWLWAFINCSLGLMIVDWSFVRLISRAYFSAQAIWDFLKFAVLAIVVFLIPLAIGIDFLVKWLQKNQLMWIISVMMYIGLSIAVILLVSTFWRHYSNYRSDRKILTQSKVGEILSRALIANVFSSLKTQRARSLFVREIAQAKITATGTWPAEFKLVVSSDKALTELAKLEERWLRLDR